MWYTIVSCGSDPAPAKGPFRTRTEAEEAIRRFQDKYGWKAGTYLRSGSVRIVGPFRTRDMARAVDISNYSQYVYCGGERRGATG